MAQNLNSHSIFLNIENRLTFVLIIISANLALGKLVDSSAKGFGVQVVVQPGSPPAIAMTPPVIIAKGSLANVAQMPVPGAPLVNVINTHPSYGFVDLQLRNSGLSMKGSLPKYKSYKKPTKGIILDYGPYSKTDVQKSINEANAKLKQSNIKVTDGAEGLEIDGRNKKSNVKRHSELNDWFLPFSRIKRSPRGQSEQEDQPTPAPDIPVELGAEENPDNSKTDEALAGSNADNIQCNKDGADAQTNENENCKKLKKLHDKNVLDETSDETDVSGDDIQSGQDETGSSEDIENAVNEEDISNTKQLSSSNQNSGTVNTNASVRDESNPGPSAPPTPQPDVPIELGAEEKPTEDSDDEQIMNSSDSAANCNNESSDKEVGAPNSKCKHVSTAGITNEFDASGFENSGSGENRENIENSLNSKYSESETSATSSSGEARDHEDEDDEEVRSLLPSFVRSRVSFLLASSHNGNTLADTSDDGFGSADDVESGSAGEISNNDNGHGSATNEGDGDFDGELLQGSKSQKPIEAKLTNSTIKHTRHRRSLSEVVQDAKRTLKLHAVRESNTNKMIVRQNVPDNESKDSKGIKRDQLESDLTNHYERRPHDTEDEEDLLKMIEGIENEGSKKTAVAGGSKEKPFRGYMKNLAEDVRHVVGEARVVLRDTGKVVHGLKKVISGAGVVTAFADNAVKYAKYFAMEPNNATVDYLEEKAIVALLEAQRAVSEAKSAAEMAHKAAKKAELAAKRAEAASEENSESSDKSAGFAERSEKLARKAENAAALAALDESKVESNVLLMDKELKQMADVNREKQNDRSNEEVANETAGKTKQPVPASEHQIKELSWKDDLSSVVSEAKKGQNNKKKGVKAQSKRKGKKLAKSKKLKRKKAVSFKKLQGKNGTEIAPEYGLANGTHTTERKNGFGSQKFNDSDIDTEASQLDGMGELDNKVEDPAGKGGKQANEEGENEEESSEKNLNAAVDALVEKMKHEKESTNHKVNTNSSAGETLKGEEDDEAREGEEAKSEKQTQESSNSQDVEEEESFKHFLDKQKELEQELSMKQIKSKADKQAENKEPVDSKELAQNENATSPRKDLAGSTHEKDNANNVNNALNQMEDKKITYGVNDAQLKKFPAFPNIQQASAPMVQEARTSQNGDYAGLSEIKADSVNIQTPALNVAQVQNSSKNIQGPTLASQSRIASSSNAVISSEFPATAYSPKNSSMNVPATAVAMTSQKPDSEILKAMDHAIQESNKSAQSQFLSINKNIRDHSEEESIDDKISAIKKQELDAERRLTNIHLARKLAAPNVHPAKVLHFTDRFLQKVRENADQIEQASDRPDVVVDDNKRKIKQFLKDHKQNVLKAKSESEMSRKKHLYTNATDIDQTAEKKENTKPQIQIKPIAVRSKSRFDAAANQRVKLPLHVASQKSVHHLVPGEFTGFKKQQIEPTKVSILRTAKKWHTQKNIDEDASRKSFTSLEKIQPSRKSFVRLSNRKHLVGEELLLKSEISKISKHPNGMYTENAKHRSTIASIGASDKGHASAADLASIEGDQNDVVANDFDRRSANERRFFEDRLSEQRSKTPGISSKKQPHTENGVSRSKIQRHHKSTIDHTPTVQILQNIRDIDFTHVTSALVPKHYHTEETAERKIEKGPVSVTVHVNRNVPNKRKHARKLEDANSKSTVSQPSPGDEHDKALDFIDPFGFNRIETNEGSDMERTYILRPSEQDIRAFEEQSVYSNQADMKRGLTPYAMNPIYNQYNYQPRNIVPTQPDTRILEKTTRSMTTEDEPTRRNLYPSEDRPVTAVTD